MKSSVIKLSGIFFLLTMLSGFVVAQKKPLDPIYDGAKDETTYFFSPVLGVDAGVGELSVSNSNPDATDAAPDRLSPLVVYSKFKGKTFVKPEKVILAFRIGSYRTFRFKEDRDLSIKVDATETKYGTMAVTERKHDSANRGPGLPNYWETLELAIDLQDYLRLVEGKKVQFQIGSTRIDLTGKNIKILKDIADKQLK